MTMADLTNEERARLFPTELVPYHEEWQAFYEKEKEVLDKVIASKAVISHIGSTAIPTVYAKPVIDILLQAPQGDLVDIENRLLADGWIPFYAYRDDDLFGFAKEYQDEDGTYRDYHVHLVNRFNNDHILFRDYLNRHRKTSRDYEKLKLMLAMEYHIR